MPEGWHAAIVKVRRACPHTIERWRDVSIGIDHSFFGIGLTTVGEPASGILLSAGDRQSLKTNRIGADLIQRDAAVRIRCQFAIRSMALRTVLIEHCPALLGQSVIDWPLILGRS